MNIKYTLLSIAFLFSTIMISQDVTIDVPIRLNDIDTISNGDILVKDANGQIAVKRYQIGQIAHGGIIFYIDESGIHGLVADTVNLTDAVLWRGQSNIQTNAISQSMGAGAMNTLLIASLQVAQDPTKNSATLICVKLDKGNYGDWYLPSIRELDLLYNNLYLAGLGDFSLLSLNYWSSSEVDEKHAYALGFSTGTSASELKENFFAVRPIRSF